MPPGSLMPMADDAKYSDHAQPVAFPRSIDDLLLTTQCPACFTALTSTVCSNCHLDLTNPAAVELAAVSKEAATALTRRVELIGHIRLDSAAAAAPLVTAPAAVAQPAVVTAPDPVTRPAAAPPSAPAPVTASVEPREPGRSSVQVVLLVVGISLLSIAAIFFLVYAFINFGLLARSLIIGGVTLAAILVASILRRRSMTATAEGIAVFAVVLLYLDAFALRANDFFGLGSVDGLEYWGATLVASAVLFVSWNRLLGMRTASIVGYAVFAPGVGMLVGSWATSDELYYAFAATTLAGLVQRLAVRAGRSLAAERVIALSTSAGAFLVALVAAFFVAPDLDFGGTFALLALAVVAVLHLLALDFGTARGRVRMAFGSMFGSLAGLAAAIAHVSAAIRIEQVAWLATVPICSAIVVILAFELVAQRTSPPTRTHALVGAIAATAAAAVIVLLPLAALVHANLAPAVDAVGKKSWTLGPTDRLGRIVDLAVTSDLAWALLGFTIAVVICAITWLATGVIHRRLAALAWPIAVLLVFGIGLLPAVWQVLAGRGLLVALALTGLLVLQRRAVTARAPRALLHATLWTTLTLGYFASWASTGTWLAATLVTIGVLVGGRAAITAPALRTALLGVATIVLIVGAGGLARQLALGLHTATAADLVNGSRAAGLAAIVLLGAAGIARGRLVSVADRRTVFWIAGAASVLCTVISYTALVSTRGITAQLVLPEFASSLVAGVLLLAALLSWVVLPSNNALRPERIAASLLLASSIFWIVDSFSRVVALGAFAESVAPMTAALLAAAGALAVTLLRPGVTARWAREVGIALVAVPAAFASVARNDDSTWLVLVLAGVTALVLAISTDGLFSSASPRKQLGWLALVLGIAGLWWRLATDRVAVLEPYVLPVAGMLLLIALLIWNAARRDARDAGRAAPALALAALLVAIMPLSLAAASGDLARPFIVGGVSAALLLVGSLVVGTPAARRYLDAAALAGAIGVLLVSVGRAITVSAELGDPDARLDAWLGAGVLLLVIAAFGQARPRVDSSAALRRTASQALAIVAFVALLALELPALSGQLATVRALSVVVLFAAIHVIAWLIDTAPFTRLVAWCAIAFAAVAAIGGLLSGALEWVEEGTVPIALALLASGGIQLAKNTRARSWAWLAPGTLAVLVPSLLATIGEAPLWRLVGLGIVGVALIILSTVLRLQAPFLIATIVVLIHAIATFSPQIRTVYEAVEWWIWLAIGGVIIVVIAARFEASKRGFARIAHSVAALR